MGNLKILYIEDDGDDREMLRDAFVEEGAAVDLSFAENGAEALEFLKLAHQGKEALPDLVVLDLNLPLIDGREAFCEIKREGLLGEIPLVVYSSSLNPADRNFFGAFGVEFIEKPDLVQQLGDIVARMLRKCRAAS